MTSRVPIFVCGERARGDDAAGFAAVDLLPPGLSASGRPDETRLLVIGYGNVLFGDDGIGRGL